MSTVDLDAIRHLFRRYAAATWDEEDGLARDLADEVPALVAEVERLRGDRAVNRAVVEAQAAALDRLRADLADEKAAHAKTCDNFDVFADSSIAERARLRQELADAHRDLTRARQAFTELLNTGAAVFTGDGTADTDG